MFSLPSALPKRSFAVVGSATLVAAGLAVAVATPSASSDPIPCDAEFATLVIQSGQDQYFECADSDGTLQQRLASKNPWVNKPDPALFKTPTAEPAGAAGQVFTGAVQGAGVISTSDRTGAERDSISREEVLIIEKDKLEPMFGSLTLEVNVLANNTKIKVESLDGSEMLVSDGLRRGPHTVSFFDGDGQSVVTDGFRISADRGEFQLGSGSTFHFATGIECDLEGGESCELTVGTTTLRATYTGESTLDAPTPVTVRVTVDDAANACGNVDLPGVEAENSSNFYNIEVYCERFIDYENDLKGEVDLLETGTLEDLADCATQPISDLSATPDGKEACILSLEWTSEETGDGLREFLSDNNLNGDPRYR